MKNRVKRVMNFRVNDYRDIEARLEKMAESGLFLKECSNFLWTFEKGEPQKLKYTVTYFSEGSIFNPEITDNQQTYFDYAKEAGWEAVTQCNQMQIFSSKLENPIPFETQESEKLENIKKCMKKSFLPSTVGITVIFTLNLFLQLSSLRRDPIAFLSDANQLFVFAMIFTEVFYYLYLLVDNFVWCKRSARSIAQGGTCVENKVRVHKVIDIAVIVCIFVLLGAFLLHTATQASGFSLIVVVTQIPLLFFIFWASIKYLKKKKATAVFNRVVSFTILFLASIAYIAVTVWLIIRFDFSTENKSAYRIVNWQISSTQSYEYKLYNDVLPLTCEDLYGQIDYEYYSYEHKEDGTIFLIKNNYMQNSLPAKDSPPELGYEILQPKFSFVYNLVKKQLLTIPQWRENYSLKPANNEIFGTVEAYQGYYEESPTGKYILFFGDKIITLDAEKALTPPQIAVISEKLQF